MNLPFKEAFTVALAEIDQTGRSIELGIWRVGESDEMVAHAQASSALRDT